MSYLTSKSNQNHQDAGEIIVISGLPRSGTSMMMKILEAGGMDVLTDHQRTADESNPQGYYEYERVKALRSGDFEWLLNASGKAVKIISALLEYLPPAYPYKVIFMRRDLDEILASQRQMLIRNGEDPDKVSDAQLKKLFQAHLGNVEARLKNQAGMQTMYVSYNELLSQPDEHILQAQKFIDRPLDVQAMKKVVNPALYRQRRQS